MLRSLSPLWWVASLRYACLVGVGCCLAMESPHPSGWGHRRRFTWRRGGIGDARSERRHEGDSAALARRYIGAGRQIRAECAAGLRVRDAACRRDAIQGDAAARRWVGRV